MYYNLPYILQFFAEDPDEPAEPTEPTEPTEPIDVNALADLVAEKDKKLTELESEITNLKKANAQMLVQMKAQTSNTVDVDKAILDFCDVRKVGQPTR